jgi:FkbM family methyltransferase
MEKEKFLNDKTTYSAHGLDIKLKKYLNFENGFFIECGAYDGIYQSNTKIYEDLMGWRGILIEPSEDMCRKCNENRKVKCFNYCLVEKDFKSGFIYGDFTGGLMSSVNGIRTNSKEMVKVKTNTLTTILKENNVKEIDLLSLDVEGYEFNVLKGLNFNIFSPKYILIEIMNHNYNQIMELLEKNNYILIENLTNFNNVDNPNWDGTHNDYLFKIKY